MELTKDINFDLDNFEKGKDFTINYSGQLFQNGSEEVYLNFGYGDNWQDKTELKMHKTSNGFSLNLIPQNSGEFNFCFRSENNIWDNNSYNNYSIKIDEQPSSLYAPVIEVSLDDTELININEYELDGIDTEFFQDSIETEEFIETQTEHQKNDSLIQEATPIIDQPTERKTFNIDAIINEILNTDITPAPAQEYTPIQPEETKIEKIVANENPTHVNKTSLLVEDVLVPFYASESNKEDSSQFLPVDTTTYSKFFTIKRKIKLVLYRILNVIPKLITGNYTKKKTIENN